MSLSLNHKPLCRRLELPCDTWEVQVLVPCMSRAPVSPVLSPPFCSHYIVFRSVHLTGQWNLPDGMKFAGPSLCLVKSLKCQNFKYGVA